MTDRRYVHLPEELLQLIVSHVNESDKRSAHLSLLATSRTLRRISSFSMETGNLSAWKQAVTTINELTTTRLLSQHLRRLVVSFSLGDLRHAMDLPQVPHPCCSSLAELTIEHSADGPEMCAYNPYGRPMWTSFHEHRACVNLVNVLTRGVTHDLFISGKSWPLKTTISHNLLGINGTHTVNLIKRKHHPEHQVPSWNACYAHDSMPSPKGDAIGVSYYARLSYDQWKYSDSYKLIIEGSESDYVEIVDGLSEYYSRFCHQISYHRMEVERASSPNSSCVTEEARVNKLLDRMSLNAVGSVLVVNVLGFRKRVTLGCHVDVEATRLMRPYKDFFLPLRVEGEGVRRTRRRPLGVSP